MPRFAANLTWLFTECDFLDRFDAAAGCGFEAVEVLFPYEHPAEAIAERLKRNHLAMVLINAPPGDVGVGERGLAALADRASDFRDSIATAAHYAETIGAPRVHVMSGVAKADDPRARLCGPYLFDNSPRRPDHPFRESLRWKSTSPTVEDLYGIGASLELGNQMLRHTIADQFQQFGK